MAQESERVNKDTRKALLKAIIVLIVAVAIIYFLGRDSINFSDISYNSVSFYLIFCVGIIFFSTVIKLFATSRAAMNGENLILPYGEDTQECVGKLIDQEALDGKILVDEYIDEFTDRKKASGEKIVLIPSYLLLCSTKGGIKGISKVTAIPRDKIYWVCAQVGRKGGPFRVRLLVFAENKIFHLIGADIEHVKNVVDILYQYIPNFFSCYDPFYLSYELEEIFTKNHAEFLRLYERYHTNWTNDYNVCDILVQNGDHLIIPREIDFFIYFKKESDMGNVAEKLLEQGFAEMSREKTENGDYGLSLTLNMVPDMNDINMVTSGILSLLENIDATFDGWGCTVVKE